MKKTDLQSKTIKSLAALALKLGIKKPSVKRKDDLIAEILTAEKVTSSKVTKVKKSSSKISESKPQKESAPVSEKKKSSIRKKKTKPEDSETVSPETPSLEHKFETPPHPAYSVPEHHASPYDNLGELPESYGTGRLFLTARDPYWLYAYWDFTWQQMEDMRRDAQNGELKIKLYSGPNQGAPLHQELTLTPSARNWYIHVDRSNADFFAEFGYYTHQGHFKVVSRSQHARTPLDRLSDRTDVRFVTIPFHISFRELFELVRSYFKDGEELADVLHRLQTAGFRFPFEYEGGEIPEEGKLVEIFGSELYRRIRMGSEELTEWFRRRLLEETSSGISSSSLSSPFGASFGSLPRGFWFSVNAELIVYGATDPEASVIFDGKKIPIKPDGTFRFQFALPDGKYRIPISATSPDGKDTHKAILHFARQTAQEGEVGVVPHPTHLKPPTRSNGEKMVVRMGTPE